MAIVSGYSCRKNMKINDYVKYVNDSNSGLVKKIRVDGFEYKMQYRPYEYIALNEIKFLGNNQNEFEKRIENLKGTAWFNLTFKRIDEMLSPMRYGVSSNEEYQKRLDYYLNHVIKDIWLVYGNDTIHPASYLFENNFNLIAQETMILGFYLPQKELLPSRDMTLSFNDKVFKNGIIKAFYSSKSLGNIPNLVYSN